MALRETKKESRGPSNIEQEEPRATLGEHLEELRVRIIRIALLLGLGMGIGAAVTIPFYTLLKSHISRTLPPNFDWTFAWSGLIEPFTFWMKMAFILGLVVTLPLTVGQIWGFVKPGLKPHEQRPLKLVVPISCGLFFLGTFLGWFVLPATVQWFAGLSQYFPDTTIIQNPSDIIVFCAKMMLAFGIGFQMPLVVFFLTRIGLLTPKSLMRYWRHTIIGVFIISAVITPSGDMLSMSVLAVPLILLFFASIAIARWSIKRQGDDPDALNDLD